MTDRRVKLSGGPDKTVTWIWLDPETGGQLNVEYYDFSEVEHMASGYKLYSNWANVQRIKSLGTLGQINGIYATPIKVDKWIKLPIKWLVNINSHGEYFIPLLMFDTYWRDSKLGQQIEQYAPQLFDLKRQSVKSVAKD